MGLGNLLNQFLGAADMLGSTNSTAGTSDAGNFPSGNTGSLGTSAFGTSSLGKLTSKVPGGVAGGAAAGGVLALLAGNKKARKFASKAAVYGGAAMLGGLAYNAFRNWQQNKPNGSEAGQFNSQPAINPNAEGLESDEFQLTLVKAMIAAAKADGHIDAKEQGRIFQALERMQLSPAVKALVLDSMHHPVQLGELAASAITEEQKTELYIASCLVIDIDNHAEREYLERLALVLGIPADFAKHLQTEAQHAIMEAA